MITNIIPNSWQKLQNQTARILEECGFSVEVEKTIETVRGAVEIDVYAEEIIKGRKYIILCECKNWKSRVPQNVIHGFRTVVSDIGANVGYIISSNGFQSGSFSAAELTNIELTDWFEFQNAFEGTWYDEYFSPKIAEDLDPLLTYSEPILPRWFDNLPDKDKKEFFSLKSEYDKLGWLIMSFTPYVRMIDKTPYPTLPVRGRLATRPEVPVTIPDDILDCESYREFYERCMEVGHLAIKKFRAIRDRNTV
jgi:restriction system protein